MKNHFSDRRVNEVLITDLVVARLPDQMLASGNVLFGLSQFGGGEEGPSAHVGVAIEIRADTTVEEMERGLINRARALLERILEEAPDTLHHTYIETQGRLAAENS